jgi:glycosyltransferase involved in cell wall biosynthesis
MPEALEWPPKAELRSRTAPPTISVVIPTLNEAANLPHVLPHIPKWVTEIIIVDGNSTDGTVEVARALHPDVRIIVEPVRGKGLALRRGFAAATGEIIVMMDADGSTNPEEIGDFVRLLCNGADFVKGSRYLQGAGTLDITPLRDLGNRGFTYMVRLLFGGRYSDLCYGYCAFWARVLPRLQLDADGFEIETMMNIRALKAGLMIFEVHSIELNRIHGTTNLRTFRDGWRVLCTIVRERLTVARPQAALPHAALAESPAELQLEWDASQTALRGGGFHETHDA